MVTTFQKALKKPWAILPHLLYLLRHWYRKVVRPIPILVEKDGGKFYRYRGRLYPEYLNTGNALRYIREMALTYCTGRGLDIGAGKWPLPGAESVENETNRNALSLDEFEDETLDFVFSSHCLEHIGPWKDALQLWIRKLKPGGVLFLYLPHPAMKLWRPRSPWVKFDHKWVPTPRVIQNALVSLSMQIVEATTKPDDYWSFRVIARKIN